MSYIDANRQVLQAAMAVAPDDATAEAGAHLLRAAVLSSTRFPVRVSPPPSAETLGNMADAVSELCMQTGAKVPDVASLVLCAAVVAARVADIAVEAVLVQVAELHQAPMQRPALSR